ncbi:MAG: hypothetical protein U9Q70_09420 [Chloroflexota bacterium]|nr:hypothetical protein [Chloroflexota bacterium]
MKVLAAEGAEIFINDRTRLVLAFIRADDRKRASLLLPQFYDEGAGGSAGGETDGAASVIPKEESGAGRGRGSCCRPAVSAARERFLDSVLFALLSALRSE